ncbi:hypothetical protein [Ulvibacterium sp.]|uniref:hypothetical protein n=1 Tax=Ulvibacterium sp. TaxID=2665914 RepID=UPI002617461E|nr:hypothetical protein [Ulvibacterium sp.]
MAGTVVPFLIDEDVHKWIDDFRGDVPSVINDYDIEYGNPSNNYALTDSVILKRLFTKMRG